ncbi:MAG: methyl-accepting chemotaxis protein [Planctomycetota bacterium]
MNIFSSKRKLSSLKLTRKFHFKYLGQILLIMIGLILIANISLYLYFEEHCRNVNVASTNPQRYETVRNTLLVVLSVETIIAVVAMVFLTVFTTHRIAGTSIKLRNAFEEVRKGNLKHRIKFRAYDHFEEVEEGFNSMMDALEGRLKEARESAAES